MESKQENPFTQFYGQLLHQGNMLADYVRTGTYQKACLNNSKDFEGKVVLDVGTGTGILAHFSLQAGAKKAYAIDASDSIKVAKKIAEANGYAEKLIFIQGKVEEIELPEKVDIIISEPIGFLLVHERMLESYVVARNRFLKPGGLMFPTLGSIVLCPLSDDSLYKEQLSRVDFWNNNDFYGLDLTPVIEQATEEYLSQPIVGAFSPSCLISTHRVVHRVDFSVASPEDLQDFSIPFSFRIDKTCILHGFGGWFDLNFIGSQENILLSTSPDCATTHWYQCRMLLKDPIAVNKSQSISGNFHFKSNEYFSYYISVSVKLDNTDIISNCVINLKDQVRLYTIC